MRVIDHKPQMYGPSRAGQLVKGCAVHAPAADQAQGHVHSFVAGSAGFATSRLSEFRSTGRPFGVGTFSADGRDSNPGLASVNHPLSDERLKNFAKGSKRHSKISDLLRPNRSNAGGQIVGHRGQSERSHFA